MWENLSLHTILDYAIHFMLAYFFSVCGIYIFQVFFHTLVHSDIQYFAENGKKT